MNVNLVKELGRQAIVDPASLPSQLSVDLALAVQEALAQAFINAGPDVSNLYPDPEVTLSAALVKHWAQRALAEKIPLEGAFGLTRETYDDERLGQVAHYTRAIKDLLLQTLGAIIPRPSASSVKTNIAKGQLSMPVLNDQPDADELTFEGSSDEFALATVKPESYQGFKADQAIILSHTNNDELFKRLNAAQGGYLDVRGIEQRQYNVAKDGVKIDPALLRMFATIDKAACIVAAANARVANSLEHPVPNPRVRLLDSTYIHAQHDQKPTIFFEQAVAQGMPIMDLETFLTLSATPEYAYLRNNTHPVALNHVLPDGHVITAAWGGDRLYLGAKDYLHAKEFRVFPAQ